MAHREHLLPVLSSVKTVWHSCVRYVRVIFRRDNVLIQNVIMVIMAIHSKLCMN